MDISKLPYTRQSTERQERNVQQQAGQTDIVSPVLSEQPARSDISSSYTRREPLLSPKLYFVISGGTVRERDYLMALERKREFKGLQVVFITSKRNEGGLTPKMMQEKVEEIIVNKSFMRNGTLFNITDIDSIYLISDVDHYADELQALVPQAKGFRWVISNPAFEIWLYYAYFNNPHVDLADIAELPQSQMSSALKTRNDRLKPGGIDPRKTFERMPEAISNAAAHYAEDKYGVPTLFATQMHHFATDVLNVIGNEYRTWLERKQELIRQFKEGIGKKK